MRGQCERASEAAQRLIRLPKVVTRLVVRLWTSVARRRETPREWSRQAEQDTACEEKHLRHPERRSTPLADSVRGTSRLAGLPAGQPFGEDPWSGPITVRLPTANRSRQFHRALATIATNRSARRWGIGPDRRSFVFLLSGRFVVRTHDGRGDRDFSDRRKALTIFRSSAGPIGFLWSEYLNWMRRIDPSTPVIASWPCRSR